MPFVFLCWIIDFDIKSDIFCIMSTFCFVFFFENYEYYLLIKFLFDLFSQLSLNFYHIARHQTLFTIYSQKKKKSYSLFI